MFYLSVRKLYFLSLVVILVMMEEGVLFSQRRKGDYLRGRNPCYDGRGCFIQQKLFTKEGAVKAS